MSSDDLFLYRMNKSEEDNSIPQDKLKYLCSRIYGFNNVELQYCFRAKQTQDHKHIQKAQEL